MSHIVTIQFDESGYHPRYSMTCTEPVGADCHADYACDCESWGESGEEDGHPWHESYDGERHHGTYDPTRCNVRDFFNNTEDVHESIHGRVQFEVAPEWDGEWYEYRVVGPMPEVAKPPSELTHHDQL